MKYTVITIFPQLIEDYFQEGILSRALRNKQVGLKTINPRKFTKDRHQTVDDIPYGGGAGLVMKIEPLVKAIKSAARSRFRHSELVSESSSKTEKILKQVQDDGKKVRIILLDPRGKRFTQKEAKRLTKYDELIFVCGRYEGVDERIKSIICDFEFLLQEMSIGPYILTGGELPAMIVVDAISRHIPGVLGKSESLEESRHGVGVPAYTRPEVFKFTIRQAHGKKIKKYVVPKVLLSGNHKKISEWRAKHKK